MSAARRKARVLWAKGERVEPWVLDYTVGDDRTWDARLLRWDVLGSLGHLEALRASGLVSRGDHARLRAGLRAALAAAARGRLAVGPEYEDVHTAVESWLAHRLGEAAGRIHTGRSRNDQVVCDLRLYLKHRLLELHAAASRAAGALVEFASRHRTALWPGYTHQRRAMPSSAGAWAAAFADGLADALEAVPALWRRTDRCPLGSAAGYGVPLPYRREAAASALGFAGLDAAVASVQAGRGKLEAAVLFWCVEAAHDVTRLASDAILFSSEEFGWLRLPASLATGSSLMPHKRNPDVFELTRARAARIEGHLAAVLAIRGRLPSGYHRDFQMLKEPVMRGTHLALEMLDAVALAVPRLEVDRARGLAALTADPLSTDEALRRAEAGTPFRTAYRQVAEELMSGARHRAPSPREILARRRSAGGLGNLGLPGLRARLAASRRWAAAERRRFEGAMARLAGTRGGGRPR